MQTRPRSRSCLLRSLAPIPTPPDLRLLATGHRDIGITEDTGHDGVFRGGVKVCYALTDGMDAPMGGMTMFARGSHLIDTPLPVSNGQPVEHEAVQPPLKRGDACLFENRIFRECGSGISAAQIVWKR